MSTRIFGTAGGELTVTSYCGPVDTDEPTRMRLQLDVPAGSYASIGMHDATALRDALTEWINDNLLRVTRRSDGAYTAGPPPDGRSVDDHLDELASGRCKHLPGRCTKCDRQACLNCRVIILPESDWEKTTAVLGDCLECSP